MNPQNNIFTREFAMLKPHDGINGVEFINDVRFQGYPFLSTYGHGYLIVSKHDSNADIAKQIVSKGYCYEGKQAYYLEEDCALNEFLDLIN